MRNCRNEKVIFNVWAIILMGAFVVKWWEKSARHYDSDLCLSAQKTFPKRTDRKKKAALAREEFKMQNMMVPGRAGWRAAI